MPDLDIFDLLDVAFDPPETKVALVRKKLEEKKKAFGAELNRATELIVRNSIQEKIAYLNDVEEEIFSGDGRKLTPKFKELAAEKTQSQILRLKQIEALYGSRVVTKKKVREYRKEFKLSEDNVVKILKENQVKILDVDPIKRFPKFPTNAESIHSHLKALRHTRNPNPSAADATVVYDLYDFAAYLRDDVKNAPAYHNKGRSELLNIVTSASKNYSQRNDDLGKLLGTLTTQAQSFVFNSDANLEAYNLYLKYLSKELTDLFSTLKSMALDDKLQSKVAETCVKKIQKYFPDFETALAIYNKEAGFKDEFYLPTNWRYKVVCNHCNSVNEFNDEEEAHAQNQCHNCQKPLFKSCVKCGKFVLASKESCPHCGYNFVEGEFFTDYVKQAEEALQEYDFTKAEDFLFKAKRADPSKKHELNVLSSKIEKVKLTLKEPIDKLNRLLSEGKYQEASRRLTEIRAKHPTINVGDVEKVVVKELDAAFQAFKSAERLPLQEKANACQSILARCVDYKPALDFLRSTPPSPCGAVSAVTAPNDGRINVSWNPSPDQGVAYRLVRKSGTIGAVSEKDGDVILDGATGCSFIDKNVAPGRKYSYSVFASRMNLFSTPVSTVAAIYPDANNCRILQSAKSSTLRISWESPQNSVGATIYRNCDAETILLAETNATTSSYDDHNVEYGKTYVYKIVVKYGEKNEHSLGVALPPYTPQEALDDYSIKVERVEGSTFRISWDIKKTGVDLRIKANDKQIASARSENRFVQVKLQEGSYCVVEVEAASRGGWKRCKNRVAVNTFTPCSILGVRFKDDANLEKETIQIALDVPSPENVKGIYCAVRTDAADEKWASKDEIGQTDDILRIPMKPNQSRQFIEREINAPNAAMFYISIFTVNAAGKKEFVSEPQQKTLARPLKGSLFWHVKRQLLGFGKMTLYLHMKCNRPLSATPELSLCISENDQYITTRDDPRAREIQIITPIALTPPMSEIQWEYEIETTYSPKQLKKRRLFLFIAAESEGDEIAIRWDRDFKGIIS